MLNGMGREESGERICWERIFAYRASASVIGQEPQAKGWGKLRPAQLATKLSAPPGQINEEAD